MPKRSINAGAAPVASFQITLVNADATRTGSYPNLLSPYLAKIEGYYAGSVPVWLQFFDSAGAPANGTGTILREVMIVPTDGFLWQYLEDDLCFAGLANGLIVCVSTTQGTLTIGTLTNKSTLYIELDEWEELITGTSTGGTFAASTQVRQVWADASGPNRLLKLEVNEVAGVDTFVQIFATDNPALNAVPIWQRKILANTANVFRFGKSTVPFSSDANGVNHDGCTVCLSLTSMVNDQNGLGLIRGTYKQNT